MCIVLSNSFEKRLFLSCMSQTLFSMATYEIKLNGRVNSPGLSCVSVCDKLTKLSLHYLGPCTCKALKENCVFFREFHTGCFMAGCLVSILCELCVVLKLGSVLKGLENSF